MTAPLRIVTSETRKRRPTSAPVLVPWWRRAGLAIVGCFVPLATWITIHLSLDLDAMVAGDEWTRRRAILVVACLGALIYSAPTVYEYGLRAFRGARAKALGFVVLVEILMTWSPLWWLSVAALAILAVINGVQTSRSTQ